MVLVTFSSTEIRRVGTSICSSTAKAFDFRWDWFIFHLECAPGLIDTPILTDYLLPGTPTMVATDLRVELPSGLSREEAKMLLAIKLYETGKVSLGQAARTAGRSKREFMDLLGQQQVPIFNYSPEELREEVGE